MPAGILATDGRDVARVRRPDSHRPARPARRPRSYCSRRCAGAVEPGDDHASQPRQWDARRRRSRAKDVVVFRWQIDCASPPAGTVTVTHRLATDATFTQSVTTTSRSCAAENVSCWTTVRPSRFYEGGRYYWQVSVAGAAAATSRTWMFQGVPARAGFDRRRPRVQAYRGAARRGTKAVFVARVADDRGETRMQVDFAYRHQLVFRAMTLLKPVRWSIRQRFDSRRLLPRSLPPGPYRLCVTAWDRT